MVIGKIAKWLVNLDFVPSGWLTKLVGFGAILVGIGGLTGLGEAAGLPSLTPKESMAMIGSGAAAIGIRRAIN